MHKKPAKPAKVPVHRAPPPQQVRIIGGEWKRTPLPVLDALGLRPTPDRVRETVFNWINHLRGGDWSDATVLDLFAGSGALGFEAASRGARSVTDARQPHPGRAPARSGQGQAEGRRRHRHARRCLRQRPGHGPARPAFRPDLPRSAVSARTSWRKPCRCAQTCSNEGGLVYAEAGAALPFAPKTATRRPTGWRRGSRYALTKRASCSIICSSCTKRRRKRHRQALATGPMTQQG